MGINWKRLFAFVLAYTAGGIAYDLELAWYYEILIMLPAIFVFMGLWDWDHNGNSF